MSASLHLPSPASGSGVMLRLTVRPSGLPRSGKSAARAEPTHIKARPVARRVALHAMRDRPREIGAISDLVARVRFGHMADDRAMGGRLRQLVVRAGEPDGARA